MKNDFDLIKEKIENSSVHAPEDMGEDFALKMIENASPKPVALDSKPAAAGKKPKRRIAAVAAIAASFVLIAGIGFGIASNVLKKPASGIMTLSGGLSLRTFSDDSQVEAAVREIIEKNGEYNRKNGLINDELWASESSYAAGSAAGSSGSSSGSSGGDIGTAGSYSDTYKQVEGVDEADIIKTDGRYIFMADLYSVTGKVDVFDVNGKSDKPVAHLNVKTNTVSTSDEAATADEAHYGFDYESYYGISYTTVRELYLTDGRLTVLTDDVQSDGVTTLISVFDVADVNNITLLDSIRQSGSYISSRMIGDELYTVSSYSLNEEAPIPVCGNADAPARVSCESIYAPETPQKESFLVVSAYNTLDHSSKTQNKAILGAADDVYCTLDNLYIYGTYYEDYHGGWYFSTENAESRILKVDLNNDLSFAGYAEVPGVIYDQYALDEYNGKLRVATTLYNGVNDENNLYVLDENLNTVGSVTGFAKNESIKAVRYLGDTAYVITYEQTDPLFVIDLSDPAAPAILGEVKITGFSTMLVPIDENTILGIGYYTQNEDYTYMEVQEGVKLALFDVSDKMDPKVLDSASYIDYYSPVTTEPKALVYNPERNDYVIPLNYWHYSYSYNGDDGEEMYGGMLNFKVENGRLVQISQYKADYDEDVERCVYVGDTVYMVHRDSDDGLRLDSVKYR